MRSSVLLLICQLTAYWPVWHWYVQRMFDGSDEPFGLLALGTALLFVSKTGEWREISNGRLLALLAILGLYVVSFSHLPALLRAALAVGAVSVFASGLYRGRPLHVGLMGLFALSLPLIASLQFYLGYPLRYLNTSISTVLLNLSGVSVAQEGTGLYWLGELVVVDAPCSGIRMLWAGLYLAFTLSCFFNLNAQQTWIAYTASGLTIFVGNVLRTVLLFYLETGMVSGPLWAHEAIGTAVFLGTALVIVKEVHLIRGRGHASLCV